TAPGYVTRKTSVHLSELSRVPPMEIKLEKQPEAPPVAAGAAVAPKDTKAEGVPMIEKGNALLEQKDYAGARGEDEGARAGRPEHPNIRGGRGGGFKRGKKADGGVGPPKKPPGGAPEGGDRTLPPPTPQIEKGNVEEGKPPLDKLPPDSVRAPA